MNDKEFKYPKRKSRKCGVIVLCTKCFKVPTSNKEMSNENWTVVDNKPCEFCGGKLSFGQV